jgi:hypothetical protein
VERRDDRVKLRRDNRRDRRDRDND